MLNGMDFCSIHDRLVVGAGHTDVEGSNGLIAYFIFSGNINARKQMQMIDSETRNFLHFLLSDPA